MFNWRGGSIGFVLVLVLSLGGSGAAAHAAKPLAKPVKSLGKQVKSQRKALGKRNAAVFARHVRRASNALRKRRTCSAIRSLGALVDATKRPRSAKARHAASKLRRPAKRVQRRLLRRARGKRACGKLGVRIARRLKPAVSSLQPLADGRPRPVTSVAGKRAQTDFVANELVLSVRSPAQLRGFLRRTKGRVVGSAGSGRGTTKYSSAYLVRIPAGKASAAARPGNALAASLRRVDPRARGSLRIGSRAGLRTLTVAAREAARGLHVGVNWLARPHGTAKEDQLAAFPGQKFLDGRTVDGVDGENKVFDAFSARHLNSEYRDADLAVVRAWQDLEVAGKLKPNSVDVAVIDSGFIQSPELPNSTYSTTKAGPEAGKERHGYFVSQTVAARPDNGMGAAGVAGPVARVRGVFYNLDGFSVMARIYDAIDTKAPIINMSFGAELPALISFSNIPFEDATQEAAAQGRLVIAAAGNDGVDVDAEDCFFACWEEEIVTPCENDGVLCIGGLGDPQFGVFAHPDSNYGFESCGSYDCTVKLFAPYIVRVLNVAGTANRDSQGTSHSSPYVAGVAALMLAANPKLTANQLKLDLLFSAHEFDEDVPANTDSALRVPRWIDAHEAVDKALPDVGPAVGILPVAGGSYFPGTTRTLRAAAVAQGDRECCTFAWRSSEDGYLGSGEQITAAFNGGPGPRVVTVRATQTSGRWTEATRMIDLSGHDPVAKIIKPTANAVLYRGVKYKWQGSWTDLDRGFADGPCSGLTWSVDRGQGAPTILHGCQPEITFGLNGAKTITLTATDADGRKSSVVRSITVVTAPSGQPPVAEILDPDDGMGLLPGQAYTLRGEATDTDGTGPISYQWTVTGQTFDEKVIGTGAQITWTPSEDVPFTCGGQDIQLALKATDPDGTSTDVNTHRVLYGPC